MFYRWHPSSSNIKPLHLLTSRCSTASRRYSAPLLTPCSTTSETRGTGIQSPEPLVAKRKGPLSVTARVCTLSSQSTATNRRLILLWRCASAFGQATPSLLGSSAGKGESLTPYSLELTKWKVATTTITFNTHTYSTTSIIPTQTWNWFQAPKQSALIQSKTLWILSLLHKYVGVPKSSLKVFLKRSRMQYLI